MLGAIGTGCSEIVNNEGYVGVGIGGMLAPGAIRRMIQAMPKVELHRHLEGAIRVETLIDVAQAYNLDVPSYDVEELRPHVQMTVSDPRHFDQFLSKFGVLRQFYRSPEVIQRITREAIEDAARDNVRYMELRFTPSTLGRHGGYPLDEVIGWVCEAAKQAASDNNILVRLIVSMNRHEPVELGFLALTAALDYRDCGVVGLDLAGRETGFPARPFCPLFIEARQEGLGVTIHAGEWQGAENVRDAIENMGATRIGHGVNIVQDSKVVQLARERGIIFEVCPTSNYQSGVVPDAYHHPVIDLHYLNLPVTLNTDDPGISNIVLSDEFFFVVDTFRLPLTVLVDYTFNAVEAAFLPPEEKAALRQQIRQAFDEIDILRES